MKKLILLFVFILGFCLIPFRADAQRQIQGRSALSAWGTFVGQEGGGFAWYGNTFDGRFVVGATFGSLVGNSVGYYVDGSDKAFYTDPVGGYFRRADALVTAGYEWRIFATRNRFFTVHAGGMLDLGGTFYHDLRGQILAAGCPLPGFVAGASASLTLELFPAKCLSISILARPRFQYVTDSYNEKNGVFDPSARWFVPVVGVGVVYYL